MYGTQKEARAAGWYSRRHPTREAQDKARERYQKEHGRAARCRRAVERQEAQLELEMDGRRVNFDTWDTEETDM